MTVRKQNDHRYEFARACSRHATGHTHTNSGGVVNELMIALIDRRRSALTPRRSPTIDAADLACASGELLVCRHACSDAFPVPRSAPISCW
jgi:hypothetical protein